MPSEITMPQLSDTMTEGTLVKWHKKEGDQVQGGEEIADVETDKATMPMEAFEDGVLAIILAKEGDKVKVGDPIGVIALSGEKPDEVKAKYAAGGGAKGATAVSMAHDSTAQNAAGAEGTAELSKGTAPLQEGRDQSRREVTRTSPQETTEQLAQRPGSAAGQRHAAAAAARPMTMPMPSAAGNAEGAGRILVSPLARRIAEDRGIDLNQVRGSGPGGRIIKRDIEEAATRGPAPSAPTAAPMPPRIGTGEVEQIELSKMRQTIATRLQQSKQQLPHFYETIDIDVEGLSTLRQKLNKQLESQDVRLSISDLVNKAIATTLKQHPALNAHFDAQNNRILRYGDVHLGIAVALEDGLIVPVLRGIDQMGLREIRQRSLDLAERAREQRLKRDEMSGATFTVSTLGVYGIREFSAIINPPEVAILAIGAAEKRAVVRGDQVVARTMMTVTLSADHRAVDGATAAEFLRTLKALMEEPGMMLV